MLAIVSMLRNKSTSLPGDISKKKEKKKKNNESWFQEFMACCKLTYFAIPSYKKYLEYICPP